MKMSKISHLLAMVIFGGCAVDPNQINPEPRPDIPNIPGKPIQPPTPPQGAVFTTSGGWVSIKSITNYSYSGSNTTPIGVAQYQDGIIGLIERTEPSGIKFWDVYKFKPDSGVNLRLCSITRPSIGNDSIAGPVWDGTNYWLYRHTTNYYGWDQILRFDPGTCTIVATKDTTSYTSSYGFGSSFAIWGDKFVVGRSARAAPKVYDPATNVLSDVQLPSPLVMNNYVDISDNFVSATDGTLWNMNYQGLWKGAVAAGFTAYAPWPSNYEFDLRNYQFALVPNGNNVWVVTYHYADRSWIFYRFDVEHFMP